MKIVQWLYTTTVGGLLRAGMTQRFFCRTVGFFADRRISAYYTALFVKQYAIALDECEKPLHAYSTFNDFFSRRLKLQARPVTYADVCFPADGMVVLYQDYVDADSFVIKSVSISVRDMCGMQMMQPCDVVIVRLRLQDYHRFHMPCDGVIKSIRCIHGGYDSVDPVVYAVGKNPLLTNERIVITIATQWGDIQYVCVGALVVGRIILLCKEGMVYRKADELGYFLCGASTIVCVLPHGMVDYCEGLGHEENFYKMGSLLGTYKKST